MHIAVRLANPVLEHFHLPSILFKTSNPPPPERGDLSTVCLHLAHPDNPSSDQVPLAEILTSFRFAAREIFLINDLLAGSVPAQDTSISSTSPNQTCAGVPTLAFGQPQRWVPGSAISCALCPVAPGSPYWPESNKPLPVWPTSRLRATYLPRNLGTLPTCQPAYLPTTGQTSKATRRALFDSLQHWA